MDLLEYEYLWKEDKERYILLDVRGKEDYLIIDRVHQLVLVIEDDEIYDKVIEQMIKQGNLIFDSLDTAYDSVKK